MANNAIDVAAVVLEATAVETATGALTASRLLAALEPALTVVTTCPWCDAARLGRWGTTRRGLQRWRCRGCGRTCTAATGTTLGFLHSLDKLRDVAADMLAETPRSCRALAAALDLDRMTVWRWRRLIADVWAGLVATHAPVEASPGADTAVVLRESRKASREWVRHHRFPTRYPAPDRLRWIDYRQQRLPLPEPMSRYRVRVALDIRANEASPIPSVGCAPATRRATGEPASAPSTALVGNGVSTCLSSDAGGDGRPASATTEPSASRFRDFLAPFAGPATRHLRTYVAWFQARVADLA